MLFVLANGTINDENTIKECMLQQVLVQVTMQEVECMAVVIMVIIPTVQRRRSLHQRILNTLDNYGYPPYSGDEPPEIDGENPTLFYCLQQDLNTTLVNSTLDAEGMGTCNISGKLVTCPVEIECKTSEADNCCEGTHQTHFLHFSTD